MLRGETLIALVPDVSDAPSSLLVTREGPGRLHLAPRDAALALASAKPHEASVAYGCAGAVRTPSGVHLLCITKCAHVGFVRGCGVFQATAFAFVSCASPQVARALSSREKRDARRKLGLLRRALDARTCRLFFSGDVRRYDPTRSTQRAREEADRNPDAKTGWFGCDHEFVWNHACGEVLLHLACARARDFFCPDSGTADADAKKKRFRLFSFPSCADPSGAPFSTTPRRSPRKRASR